MALPSGLDQLQQHAIGSDDDADGDNEEDTRVPEDLDVARPYEDDTYPNFESLRHAINAWSLRDGFIARCSKKDTTRAQYRCRFFRDGCQWAVRATISRSTGLLTVTSVVPEHTCSPPDIWVNHEGIEQRGKRAVHATQRWVVDTLNRLGYKPQVNTDPKDIVKFIQDRCGLTITEKLALKSRDRLLTSMGIQPPLPHGRGGRPDQIAERKRTREAEAAMAQQRSDDRISREQETFVPEIDTPGDVVQDDGRPFVFESGYRVLGPTAGSTGPQPSRFVRPNMTPSAVEPSLSRSSMSTTPSVPATRPCHTCSGTGIMPATTSHVNGNSRAAPVPAATSVPKDDELSLMKQQIALLARQIDLMQKRRAGAG